MIIITIMQTCGAAQIVAEQSSYPNTLPNTIRSGTAVLGLEAFLLVFVDLMAQGSRGRDGQASLPVPRR